MPSTNKNPSFKTILKDIGPGLITGASDDDPSGIATYSQAGAKFGLTTLWTVFLTFPLMVAIQETCARIGAVTSHGLMTNIKKHYPSWLMYFVLFLTIPAIILNIGADIEAMAAVAHLLIPIVPIPLYGAGFAILLVYFIIRLNYQKVSAVLKYLCLSLFLYLITPFLVKQNWLDVLKHTLLPHIKFNKDFISILVAILGTTISPYLFFWQATMEAEERKKPRKPSMKEIQIDVIVGMLVSNVVMYFIIFTTGSILFQNGIQDIQTVEQAAKALEPLAGKFCYIIFALGVLGTGLLSVPVLCGTCAYTFATVFNWKSGLDKKFHEAKLFYLVIIISLLIGFLITLFNINPIQILINAAILYGLVAPILILIILKIANDKKIMGNHINGKLANVLCGVTFFLMTIAALTLILLLLI